MHPSFSKVLVFQRLRTLGTFLRDATHVLFYASTTIMFCIFVTDGSSECRPGMRGGHQMCIDLQTGMLNQFSAKDIM